MQRITRLPLLLDAILKRLHSDDEEFESCQVALATVNNVSIHKLYTKFMSDNIQRFYYRN